MNKTIFLTLVAAAVLSTLLVHVNVARSQKSSPAVFSEDSKYYNLYMQIFGKVNAHYTTSQNMYRFTQFKLNAEQVEKHNELFKAGKSTFELGLNDFSAMSVAEFSALQMGLDFPESAIEEMNNDNSTYEVNLNQNDLPKSVDWRVKGAVNPVKNQGKCGSCYSFSAISAIESLHYIKNGTLKDFSEQQIVDCSRAQLNMGCSGGLQHRAFNQIKKHGLALTAKYPQTAKAGKCVYDQDSMSEYKITGHKFVNRWTKGLINAKERLMSAVAVQPVSIALNAASKDFQMYKSGVFDGKCGIKINHAVTLVGLDSENGQDQWLVRNSWGSAYGEDGYIRIIRDNNALGHCGMLQYSVVPTA